MCIAMAMSLINMLLNVWGIKNYKIKEIKIGN
jgi:hypothetical protein